MRRQYASSVYSQKSTTSAKSSRSFLSLTTPIWPTTNDSAMNESNQTGVWQSLKSWIPNNNNKKKKDSDSILTTRSTSSINKFKQLFVKKKTGTDNISPRLSFTATEEEEEEGASTSTTSINNNYKKSDGPAGILINRGCDSAEAILERKKRRSQRREYILKLQKHNKSLQHHHIVINKELPIESSSSDTLLTDDDHPTNAVALPSVKVGFAGQYDDDDQEEDDWTNPRIMFVEPSPVPRFRNVAPPPPPSPAYLNILIQPQDDEEMVIKSPLMNEEEATIFTTKNSFLHISDQPRHEHPLYDDESIQIQDKPRLYFNSPLRRGQTLKFSLQNTIPDDHIILYKFLTSNTTQQQPERYFVQPSAGKMVSTDQSNILLILNQPPNEFVKKDKIMIQWAVIQKNTRIEQWVNNLPSSTRRKWINMLDEEWPDQVTIRMTRIKIRFV
ncbi:hypothetical protein BDF21DRAFT_420124 [Thamnidium elegans]|uniref:MSP domain-containing protein n=1 Tax=Thamnidium elegans TaxID=101142 RepID=A0A8H7SUX3_9FUNG|nr:hypothetical protein INT48_007014 [Thamnidium elegans]KAI8079449.1 hypothetical protein BDF21DRAFT_420124 [Thamnidium elegans]